MTMVEYERNFYELMLYVGISDTSPLMVDHFIWGLNDSFIGSVKVFHPKTLKDAVHRDTLVEKIFTLGHGGFVGAPASGYSPSGSKGT